MTPSTGKKRAPAKARKPPRRQRGRKKDWKPEFLKQFARVGTVKGACEAAKISRQSVYDARKQDAEFAEAWDAIEEDTTELMEREAYRRAVEGVDRPVYQGGEQVGSIRDHSDTLLIFMLKARRPDVYRERLDVSGKLDVPGKGAERAIDSMDGRELDAYLLGVDEGRKAERVGRKKAAAQGGE